MQILFVGAGHSHLMALSVLYRHFKGRWPAGLSLTVVSPSAWQYYSGRLPGWVAGHHTLDECRIDAERYLVSLGVRFIENTVVDLALEQKQAVLKNGRRLSFDYVCLDIGSDAPTDAFSQFQGLLFKVKAMQAFQDDLTRLLTLAQQKSPLNVGVVGAGAGGVELASAVAYRLQRQGKPAYVQLFTGERGLLPGYSDAQKAAAEQGLQAVGVTCVAERVTADATGVKLNQGHQPLDALLLANGQKAWPWLKNTGLRLSEDGFVLVDSTHRSLSHPFVFACGDTCKRRNDAFGGARVVPSGVHAVFSGKALGRNLAALIGAKPEKRDDLLLKPYIPKQKNLYLLSLGKPTALLAWGRITTTGEWVWKLKDWIDSRFFRKFSG